MPADEVEAVIRKTGEDWARYWNSGDVDKLAATYTDGAVYLPPHHAAVHGRDQIREYLSKPIGHGISQLSFEVSYIRRSGDVAWDVGLYQMKVPKDGGQKEDKGKYLTVWQRQKDGSWKIVADAWSSDLPAPG